jgi:hypothetical protein
LTIANHQWRKEQKTSVEDKLGTTAIKAYQNKQRNIPG